MTAKPFSLAWTTDIHINFCHPVKFKHWCNSINAIDVDALVITGDISEGHIIRKDLEKIQGEIQCPVYFVLGNHDYYKNSVKGVRDAMETLFCSTNHMTATWLGSAPYIALTDGVALVGHDGWYDGLYADWMKSRVLMADYHVIHDFIPLHSGALLGKMRELSLESAEHVKLGLLKAIEAGHRHLFVGTHVPPWKQNAVYQGKVSDDDWLPHFSSKYMGDAIFEVAQNHPQHEFTVLCGHSHGEAKYMPLPNVVSYTGAARYRRPSINKVFYMDNGSVHKVVSATEINDTTDSE